MSRTSQPAGRSGRSDAPALGRVQQMFWDLITAPAGVVPGLAGLEAAGRVSAEEFAGAFAGDAALPAAARLDIYANMYFYRLHDCLKEDFPRTAAWIGADRFHNLVTDFLLRHPSSSPSLRDLGAPLPDFIAAHVLSREFPGLADMARLEWARADIFDAADATPLSREALAALPADRVGDARLRMVPAFRLLRLRHDVVPLWRELEAGAGAAGTAGGSPNAAADRDDDGAGADHAHRCEPAAPPGAAPRRPTPVRVWRQRFTVYHKRISEDEAHLLEGALAGEPFERLCQRLAAGRTLAKATIRVGRLMQEWLEDGILASMTIPE